MLVPESIYGPNRKFANDVLRRFGVEASFYAPGVGSEIAATDPAEYSADLVRKSRLYHHGSTGRSCHRRGCTCGGALLVIDNTWSAGVYFDAFAHGADVTMQALTKYVGGHSDLLLGSVTTKDKAIYQRLGATHQLMGCAASPDDCSLALRGMKTLAVRLEKIEASALTIAHWLATAARRLSASFIRHWIPVPGHELWKRDFTGSAGVFSVVLKSGFNKQQIHAFMNTLELFKIGYSWGGVTSLAVGYDFTHYKERPQYHHRIIRLNIGLEEVEDLICDLGQAFDFMKEAS